MRVVARALLLLCFAKVVTGAPIFGGSDDEDITTTTTAEVITVAEETPTEAVEPDPEPQPASDQENNREEKSEAPQDGTEHRRETTGNEVTDESLTEAPVQRNDDLPPVAAPDPPIEIRLIDENKNQSQNEHVESAIPPPPLSQMPPDEDGAQEENRGNEQETLSYSPSSSDSVVNQVEPPPAQQSGYEAKYKKVEYVSDVLEAAQQAPPVTEAREDDDATSTHATHQDETLAPTFDDFSTISSIVDLEAMKKIQLANMFAASKRLPEGPFPDEVRDEDLPVFEGSTDDNEDDEPEPVEECLANKNLLSDDIVHRMRQQAERLTRHIRRLNKQQHQYCTTAVEHGENMFNDHFSQCPIWREEKIVHYYKLMRITYCADYSKWPNAARIQKTYGQYLPLFETLYAFQKQ